MQNFGNFENIKRPILAPMVASILFLVSSSSLEKRVSRTREKDTADSGKTVDGVRNSCAPNSTINR